MVKQPASRGIRKSSQLVRFSHSTNTTKSLQSPELIELKSFASFLIRNHLEASTRDGYNVALRAWESFTKRFHLPFLPTSNSLVLFIAFTIPRIATVDKYLSALASYFKLQMEDWDAVRHSEVVRMALKGAAKWKRHTVKRVNHLLPEHLDRFLAAATASKSYNDLLFAAISTAGFFALHRLGEVVIDDSSRHLDPRKIIARKSVVQSPTSFSYTLPYNKTDPTFLGSLVVILASSTTASVQSNQLLTAYLRWRDRKFGLSGDLFLKNDGSRPTRKWYIDILQASIGSSYAGHSLRPGGATWYALKGASADAIRRLGRWAPNSTAWEQYIRAHPSVFIALQSASINHKNQQ